MADGEVVATAVTPSIEEVDTGDTAVVPVETGLLAIDTCLSLPQALPLAFPGRACLVSRASGLEETAGEVIVDRLPNGKPSF
jgi:hypothetical protein